MNDTDGTPSATEPLGGQPPAGASLSVDDLDYQVKYQRAFEAVLWALPAVAIYRFRAAAFDDLGLSDNEIIAYSAAATPLLEALTANNSVPYIAAYADLRNGPVVLEVPAAGPTASLYGQVVDAWQHTIAGVGPAGVDGGAGGKYVFTPPGYDGVVPDGYLHVASPNYRIAFAFRSIPAAGHSGADAYAYSQELRMYDLAEADNPARQRFIDPRNERYATLPFYDERYFEDVFSIVSVEPVKPEDKLMMGMLESLGIRHGQPFSPDATARRAMRQAAIDAWHYLQSWYDHYTPEMLYWPDRHYASLMQPDDHREFLYVYDDRIDLTARAAQYFWATYYPVSVAENPTVMYLAALADGNGHPLEAGATYTVDIPADMPVSQFWAITVYDRATFSFIYSASNRTTLSSYDLDTMRKNPDGSVTIYIGPEAPEGIESNWIPTSGKRPMPTIRYYGATTPLHERTFTMPDLQAAL